MYRYINLNLNPNPNSLNINKKPQKTKPISLLSGGNSFFVKVKSNQIATNYNDKNNKLKPSIYHKINNTYISKENKNNDKSLNKYLNNSQPKVSFLFTVNYTINQRKMNNNTNNNKSLISKTKQEIYTHNRGIYSFTSNKINDKINNKSINQSSLRNNYNAVLVTDFDHMKINMNKISTIPEKSKEAKKPIKEKNGNNIINYNNKILQSKTLNGRNKLNNKKVSESLIKNEPKNQEKISNLTDLNKNNNQFKLVKKNQNIAKINNKNVIRYKNISNILFNTNPNIEKNKNNNNKNTKSEGKNRVIFQGQKKNNKIINYNYSNNIDNNTFTNILKDNIAELDEINSGGITKRKNDKKIKNLNVKSNNEGLRIQTKYNYNTTKNDKSLILQKKNDDNNINMDINQHISTKSNNIINKNPKLDNILHDYKINFNHEITNITDLNSNNLVINGNTNLINENISSIKKSIEINNPKDNKYRNKNNISGLNSLNVDNHRQNNNYPNIIINNNYLYNYKPFVTLNNSSIEGNSNRFKLNRNSFIDNNYYINNTTENLPIDKFLNYSTLVDNKILNKENKNLINKKNRIDVEKLRANLLEEDSQNNNNVNNEYNLHTKFISSNNLENNINKSKTNRTNLNLYHYKENNNNHKNITDNYISKEKSKKRKQNPPLNKNPKKLNILSLIQENNRKIKPNTRGKNSISTYINQNKSYNNNKNDYITIEQILYPENDKINYTSEKFDNFDDINTIVKRINFENVDLKKNNIFTVDNKYTEKNLENNIWYEQFSENFNVIFDKKFENNKQNMSAAQNKIKKNNYIYHSRQSGSTKASNKENSSGIKKIRVSSYIDKRLDNSGIINNNKKINVI